MKRLLSFFLVCLLMFSFSWVYAQTTPFVQILTGAVENQTLSLTLRVGKAGEFTCLVYAANEKGEAGELLQVAQWQVEQAGIHKKEIAVPFAEQYSVQVGGADIELPKTMVMEKEYSSSALRLLGEETTGILIHNASHLTGVEITRAEKTVTPGDVVLPGDKITATLRSKPYVGYAVVAGDVDLDGAVNAKDALLVLRHAVGKTTLTESQLAAADFKQNGKIDAVCALNILKFSVGKLKSL